MNFSLIVGTYGRCADMVKLLDSLSKQTNKSFELIVVDQNDNDDIVNLLDRYNGLINYKHIKVREKGLSNARNIGLDNALGEIVAFPDDDCFYPDNLLETIYKKFTERSHDFITFKCMDFDTRKHLLKTFSRRDKLLNVSNVMRNSMSISIFALRNSVENLRFNKTLGSGQNYGSGEESDFLLNLLEKGCVGHYYSDLEVYHPLPNALSFNDELTKLRKYALGHGKVIKDHMSFAFTVQFLWSMIIRPFIGIIISVTSREKMLLSYNLLKFRWLGFFHIGYSNEDAKMRR